VLAVTQGGGGGYGNPLERDPALVATDVLDGYVSYARARADYGVIVDPASGVVDGPATERERGARPSAANGATGPAAPATC
jgi:N-methylhydantoinase B